MITIMPVRSATHKTRHASAGIIQFFATFHLVVISHAIYLSNSYILPFEVDLLRDTCQ